MINKNIERLMSIFGLMVMSQILLYCCEDFSQFDCFNHESGCSDDLDQFMTMPVEREPEAVSPNQTRRCSVNELRVCEICDTNGEVKRAPTDDRCPMVECLDQYTLVETEEEQICYVVPRTPIESGLCYQRGLCHTEDTLCIELEGGINWVESKSSDFEIKGCVGSIPPDVVRKTRDR